MCVSVKIGVCQFDYHVMVLWFCWCVCCVFLFLQMKALESGVLFNDEWSLCVQGTHCTHKGIRKSHFTMLSFGEMETHKQLLVLTPHLT